MPSIASIACSSSANVARAGRRSRPYELTFWPSSVTSRTPSAASRATSATSSSNGRETSAPRVDGTMQYEHAMLQPTEICTHAWNSRAALVGQVAGEALELEEALRGDRVGRQELGELVDLAGAERDVDEREAREDLVLDRLRPAAADADDPRRVLALQALGVAEVGEELRVGLLADRAGVEEDHVGVVGALASA